jgi:uncharacterized OB-fold protein
MTRLTSVSLLRTKDERYKFLGEEGRVVSFTSIAVPPRGLTNRAPYLVAVVEFGKERATLQLANVEAKEVKVGMKVMGVMRRMSEPSKDGIIVYGVKGSPY